MSTETLRRHRRRIGVTLIELAFVIAIIAILVVAALAVYRAVSATLDVNEAVRDVATVRQAMKNFAGDDRICCGEGTADLTSWNQLRGFLSGALHDKAREAGAADTVLEDVNPWQGNYEFTVDDAAPYQFVITITDVDNEVIETLVRKLEDGAQRDDTGNPLVAAPTDTSGSGKGDIEVTYPV